MHAIDTVEMATQGDKAAINALVQLWYKRIYNFCYRYFYDHDLASEVTQQTCVLMYQKIHSLRESEHFKSWLYRIAMNQCHEEARRQKRSKVVAFSASPAEEDWLRQTPASQQADSKYHNKELGEMLFAMISELPIDQRVVVIMKEYEGFKFKEIADTLKISENTAKSRLYYGLKSLKKALESRNMNLQQLLG